MQDRRGAHAETVESRRQRCGAKRILQFVTAPGQGITVNLALLAWRVNPVEAKSVRPLIWFATDARRRYCNTGHPEAGFSPLPDLLSSAPHPIGGLLSGLDHRVPAGVSSMTEFCLEGDGPT